jgi:hypothetical protein
MPNKIWMFSVFIFLILIAPILLIMMLLVLTDIPLTYSFLWIPVAVLGSWFMNKWACRENQKLFN